MSSLNENPWAVGIFGAVPCQYKLFVCLCETDSNESFFVVQGEGDRGDYRRLNSGSSRVRESMRTMCNRRQIKSDDWKRMRSEGKNVKGRDRRERKENCNREIIVTSKKSEKVLNVTKREKKMASKSLYKGKKGRKLPCTSSKVRWPIDRSNGRILKTFIQDCLWYLFWPWSGN